jgi:hypothetical protein
VGGTERGTEGQRDRGTEGQRDRGTEGQRDRGTEGQRDRGTEREGVMCHVSCVMHAAHVFARVWLPVGALRRVGSRRRARTLKPWTQIMSCAHPETLDPNQPCPQSELPLETQAAAVRAENKRARMKPGVGQPEPQVGHYLIGF